jgi:hypothetical protein
VQIPRRGIKAFTHPVFYIGYDSPADQVGSCTGFIEDFARGEGYFHDAADGRHGWKQECLAGMNDLIRSKLALFSDLCPNGHWQLFAVFVNLCI